VNNTLKLRQRNYFTAHNKKDSREKISHNSHYQNNRQSQSFSFIVYVLEENLETLMKVECMDGAARASSDDEHRCL
jgi:hypothetical protein